MMPEERAALVAWQLLAPGASIERFKCQLEQQTHPDWNRAVRLIADTIRDAEVEVREAAREAIEGYREREDSLEADLAKEADAGRSVGEIYGLGDETPLAERLEEYPETPDWVETYDTSGRNSLVLHCREVGTETRIELIEGCTQFVEVCCFLPT